jgi:NAD(P)-dependent dehydrogenase (short-subunit alcohol dehydrogenase family)
MTVRLGLDGRCALVTGASSEIGRACVRRLREEGMTVAESGDSVEIPLELGSGRLDVLVTCPRVVFEGSIEATPEDVFRELLDVNLTSLFRAARACFAPMREQGRGSMILVASEAGIRAVHETAAYSVAMAGVIAVAELFAAEGAPHGVRSNAVCPNADADVASLVAWLASDESVHMSGATLRVDGGSGAAMRVAARGDP